MDINKLIKLLEEDVLYNLTPSTSWAIRELYNLIKHLLPYQNAFITISKKGYFVLEVKLTDAGLLKKKILRNILKNKNSKHTVETICDFIKHE